MADKTQEELLEIARKRFAAAYDFDRDEREKARDDLFFGTDYDGAQWPEEIRSQREQSKAPRPCLTINKIPEKIDVVKGDFVQSEPKIRVLPVDSNADPIVAEILGGLIRHIEYDSAAKAIYENAYTHVLYCGRGAWRINTKEAVDDWFSKDLCIEPIPNVFSVFVDPMAKKLDISDAKYIFVTETIKAKEFREKYGEEIDFSGWETENEDFTYWRNPDESVRIAEYWFKKEEEKQVFLVRRMVNDQEVVMSVDENGLNELTDRIEEEKTIKTHTVYWMKMTADRVLEGPVKWPGKYIPIVMAFGKRVNIDGRYVYRGMVRPSKDAMRMYNYWSSSIAEQVALQPKAPYIVTQKMVEGYEDLWDGIATNNFPYLVYNPDPSGLVPRREPPPQMSTGMMNELARLEHDLMTTMGIYHASLGDAGAEKSGRAIIARQKQGNLGTAEFMSNFILAMTYSGKILVDLIPHVYDTERIIRVRGNDGKERNIPINALPGSNIWTDQRLAGLEPSQVTQIGDYINDLSVGKYDVRISIGPTSETQRHDRLMMLLELARDVPGVGQVIPDLIAKSIDMPGADELYERLKKLVPPAIRGLDKGEMPPPPPPPDPEIVLKERKQQLEEAKLQYNMAHREREQQRKEFEAMTERMAAQFQAMLDLAKAQAEQSRADMNELKTIVETTLAKQGKEKVG